MSASSLPTKRIGSMDLRALLQAQTAREIKMTQPRELTCWTRTSITDGMQTRFADRTGLHPFACLPAPGEASLADGFPNEFIRKPEGNEPCGVETIIRAAQQAKVAVAQYDIVTYRNNLNKIFNTPLKDSHQWTVDGCMVGKTLFLDIVRTPEKRFADADRFEYFGYKFESLCTKQPGVDATSEFGSVLHVHVGDHRVVMAAEIDCFDPQYGTDDQAGYCGGGDDPVARYVELKTHRAPRSHGATARLYGIKFARWWVQSWLAGVRRIAVGAWEADGTLVSTRMVETAALARESRAAGHEWKPFHLLTVGHEVLAFMREMGAAHAERHLRFCCDRQEVVCSVLEGGDLVQRIEQNFDVNV